VQVHNVRIITTSMILTGGIHPTDIQRLAFFSNQKQ